MGQQAKTGVRSLATKQTEPFSAARKPASSFSIHSPVEQILYLQRTLGNQATQRLFESGIIPAKLKINQPNDIYEQEADRVADQLMRMSEPTVQQKPT